MKARAYALPMLAVLLIANAVAAQSVAGKWKAEFDTPIGVMKYVYEFKVDGEKLTGKAVRDFDSKKIEVAIAEGKVKGDTIFFTDPSDTIAPATLPSPAKVTLPTSKCRRATETAAPRVERNPPWT